MEKKYLRAIFALFVIVPASSVLLANTDSVLADTTTKRDNIDHPVIHKPSKLVAAHNLTVVTAHYEDEKNGSLTVFTGDKEVVYKSRAYQRIFDIDPTPGEEYTVTYVGGTIRPKSSCKIKSASSLNCIRNVIVQVNLSTGTSKRIYTYDFITYQNHDGIHDVDRINDTHYLVADIFHNRVFIVNTSSNVITWEWRARSEFSYQTGGEIEDWTHINDVEYLEDQNIVMVDPRNHDQVWFIHHQRGLLENLTLGEDNNHTILYEQHNPDYIPEERGGPALLIADSENNRIIEYQRKNGNWTQSWVWQDTKMQWPRDADRLPNGETLITDTHSNRILEVNKEGEIVWQVTMAKPYEAERLGTGDESTHGKSAKTLGYKSRTVDKIAFSQKNDRNLRQSVYLFFRSIIPSKIYHGIKWVVPAWIGLLDLFTLAISVMSLGIWSVSELYWTDRITIKNPVELRF